MQFIILCWPYDQKIERVKQKSIKSSALLFFIKSDFIAFTIYII